jgi:ABC-type lipoprotein export system ATPase subunit
VIKLKNVSKYYYSKGMIASGISKINLEFNKGEFVVITGESGSGKTTLLNVISGLDSYEDGEMYIDGKETSHYLASDFEEYRKKYIGNIFQNFNLINSYTVYQNVELILLVNGYKKDEVKSRVNSIIEKVGLAEYAKTKVSKLSGGQKQRVSIARALAKETDIIVADEPTGNLDSASADGIVQLLSDISKDKLVIVVTHNFDQFESYATRKIKMYDGKVVEDDVVAELPAAEPESETAAVAHTGKMSVGSKVRLGVRNTFNIAAKFILLLIVFLFVVTAVSSAYTSYQHNNAEANKLGWNQYFNNYQYNRVILKKADNSQFTADDYSEIQAVDNIESVAKNDILLDTALYIEDEKNGDDFSFEVYPKALDEYSGGELVYGTMPEADNEGLICGDLEMYGFSDDYFSDLIGKEYSLYLSDGSKQSIVIAGIANMERDSSNLSYAADLYISDSKINGILKSTYAYTSTVTTTINGKAQVHIADNGDASYQVMPSSKVAKGKAVLSEEANNFYEKGKAKGHKITIEAENIFYKEKVSLEVSDVYTKKTFEKLTGAKDYDTFVGTVYINQADYNTLFAKGNYQITAYVKDTKSMDDTLSQLEDLGYTKLALKDTLVLFADEVTQIIQIPMLVIMIVALLLIAYFVIRLIFRSRKGYFSILRMLGLSKRNIKRIIDIELFIMVNIAFLIFLAIVVLTNMGIIGVEYIKTLIEYMAIKDYVILYIILVLMALLISGKYSRNLFKKTAMGTFREEE